RDIIRGSAGLRNAVAHDHIQGAGNMYARATASDVVAVDTAPAATDKQSIASGRVIDRIADDERLAANHLDAASGVLVNQASFDRRIDPGGVDAPSSVQGSNTVRNLIGTTRVYAIPGIGVAADAPDQLARRSMKT